MNSISYIVSFLFIVLFGAVTVVSGQKISAFADRERIYIGEQIHLTLTAQGAKPGMGWFNIPDSVNHIEVVEKGKIDTAYQGNTVTYQQVIKLTSFDSGRWVFPALTVAGVNQVTLPVTIDVLPVDVSQLQDYNEIKEIEEVEVGNNRWITIVISIVTLIALVLLYFLLRKRKPLPVTLPSASGSQTPLEWAMAELNKLPQQPAGTTETKNFYSSLSFISRTFFHMQLQQNAMEATTDEWMVQLQELPVNNEIKTTFFQFLRLADAVKFAKYLPPSTEHTISIEAIKQMLNKSALLHTNLYSKYQPR